MRIRTLLWISSLFLSTTAAAVAQAVEEPPIPVTIICPYHEDSLRRAYEAGLGGGRRGSFVLADSLGRDLVESTQDLATTVQNSFLLVYILLGIMALITLAALRVAYRLRIEVQEVRDERRIFSLALPSPTVVESRPISPAGRRRTGNGPKKRRKQSSTPRSNRRPAKRRA
ncbi:MAG: hypothetical protein AABY75_05960 [Bacteroidota bacterium]